jgi:hypothetical protein
VPVINIDSRGKVVDGRYTGDEQTRVRRLETVTWNSEGGGPWVVRFSDKIPLLDNGDPIPPGTDILVPRNARPTGRSKTFVVSAQAGVGNHYPYRVDRATLAGEPPGLLAGPELIIDPGGGGILHEGNSGQGKPKKPRAAATTVARKAAGGRKTAARKVALRKTAARKSAKASGRKTTARKATARKTTARKSGRTKRAAKKR